MIGRSVSVVRVVAALVVLCLAAAGSVLLDADQSTAAGVGRVQVVIKTPADVPANVELTGRRDVVFTKKPARTSQQIVKSVPTGRYTASAPVMTYDGRMYRATLTKTSFRVRSGATVKLVATFKALPTATRLTADEVTASSVSLTWRQPSGSVVKLRRAAGEVAPASVKAGSPVPVTVGAATDAGLQPASQYSYSLFTKVAGRWQGPLTVSAGTPSADGAEAAYVAPPTSTIVEPGDSDLVTVVNDEIVVKLAADHATPLVGSGFALPVSELLPSGYVGVVKAVTTDGRTVTLAPGGLADLFTYYDIHVDLSDVPPAELTPVTDDAQAAQMLERYAAAESMTDSRASDLQQRTSTAAAALPSCLKGSYAQQLSWAPTVQPSGHFDAGLIKKWGAIPVAAWYDIEATMTVGSALSLKTSGSVSCGIPFETHVKTLTTSPIPIAMAGSFVAEVNAGANVKIANLGGSLKAGFWSKGQIGADSSIDGGLIKEAAVYSPTLEAVGSVSAELGGKLTIGPGAGTKKTGVVVGVGGKLIPLKLTGSAVFAADDTRYNSCLKGALGGSAAVSLDAKAFAGKFTVTKSVTLDALQQSWNYGDPKYWPTNCEKPADPTEDVTGDGVEPVDTSTSGAPDQFGHVDGFSPGEQAWVLSTGNVADAVGSPDHEASTDLGREGSAALDALSGGTTYDAATYVVTVRPSGDMLHVRYVFASEEYPEWVDAGFNDVMAIFVNGQNCALVPGTSTAVSVDSINDHTNSQYYVDGANAPAGYQTAMDGLTVPLTCSVPVVPGSEVDVRISVADNGDGILDSAIGIVDRGIYSD